MLLQGPRVAFPERPQRRWRRRGQPSFPRIEGESVQARSIAAEQQGFGPGRRAEIPEPHDEPIHVREGAEPSAPPAVAHGHDACGLENAQGSHGPGGRPEPDLARRVARRHLSAVGMEGDAGDFAGVGPDEPRHGAPGTQRAHEDVATDAVGEMSAGRVDGLDGRGPPLDGQPLHLPDQTHSPLADRTLLDQLPPSRGREHEEFVASHEDPLLVSGPELQPPDLAALGNRPGAQIAHRAADQHGAVAPEIGADPRPTEGGEVGRDSDGLAAVPGEELKRQAAGQRQPLPVRAERHCASLVLGRFHEKGGWRGLEHAQGEAPGLIRVGQLQALDGIREGGGGVSLHLGLTQGEQLAGLRAEGFRRRPSGARSRCGSRTSPTRPGRAPSRPRPRPRRSDRRRLRRFARPVMACVKASSRDDRWPE